MSASYIPYQPERQQLLPSALQDWLPPGHLAYFIGDTIDSLNLSAFHARYAKDGARNQPFHPAMMVKVLVYAYATGVFSSRKIGRKLHVDVAFRVLGADNFPAHRTIREFPALHLGEFTELFTQVVRLAREMGLVKLGTIAVDGTKIKANASGHKAMSYGRMQTTEAELKAQIAALVHKAANTDEAEKNEPELESAPVAALTMLTTPRPRSMRRRTSSWPLRWWWIQSVVATSQLRRCCMGRAKGWMEEKTGRSAMRSPGRPEINQRLIKQAFWEHIAAGLQSEDAARAAGVSQPLGPRWFRQAGGIAPTNLGATTGRYLSFAEREEISLLHAQQLGVREIARRLERAPSTISRELRRNAATRAGKLQYRATVAQWKAERAAQRPKVAKLAHNDRLRAYVQEQLGGTIQDARGKQLPGPQVPWNGRRRGRRADRRWSKGWSPEQISQRLRREFPDDASMRVSHEAIYQALYIQGRGALKRELTACLRTGRALRVPQARTRQRGRRFITPELMISERPAEIADRAIPGHWEGDLIIGLNSSAVGTLVERTTRFTMLLHLPPMPGHGAAAQVKNGPALAGHGAEAVRNAIALKSSTLPDHLGKSLTWDQGAEMAQHVQLRIETGLEIYFCDPRSPWQRGTNENTNGLLRQYFPKGTDMSRYDERELDAVAATLNGRPRKTLGWQTPTEALNRLLSTAYQADAATTP